MRIPIKFLLLGYLFASHLVAQEVGPVNGYKVYKELKGVELDPGRVADIQNLTLKRDAGTFYLQQGKLYLLKPVLGKVSGAVFIGSGNFQFIPPTEIEKYQLEKFYGDKMLSRKFSELYLRFTDNTADELISKLQFAPSQIEGKAKSIKDDCGRRALKLLGKNLNARVLEDLLFEGIREPGGIYSGFFYADIKLEDGQRTFFSFDPKNLEEIQLWRETPVMAVTDHDLVCSFHRAEDYKIDPLGQFDEEKDEITPRHYKMDIRIENTGMVDKLCELTLDPVFDGIRVIQFDLDYKVKLKGEPDTAGKDLLLIVEKDQYGLTVVFPKALKKGQRESFAVRDSCDCLERDILGNFYIYYTESWYPHYGYLTSSTFDLTFRTPRGHQFVSAGRKIKEWTEGDYHCSQWLEETPVNLISFNIGNFDIYKKKEGNLPEISVYWDPEIHKKASIILSQLPNYPVVTVGKDMEKNVAADVINSLSFYSSKFGEYPLDHMAVTEIPRSHGQAFSGLLHLSWGTFQEEDKFYQESFRSHEVSHQWWGHLVGWKTYRDQWLSVGLAKYSGIWFAQLSLKDNKHFFDMLKFWRDNIIRGYASRNSIGTKAGPLWLGIRLNNSKSYDYYTMTYEKGGYILHMLRNMLMDFGTRSDEKFIGMLRDFATAYSGKNPSTKDFQEIVEKHVGADMDWFFNQWVYGTEIPKYTYSYTTEKVGEKHQVTLKVRQEKVSPGFKMLVPVVLNYKPEGYSVFRVWVDQPEQEIKLPLVPLPVSDIVFNPFYAVLCEVEQKQF